MFMLILLAFGRSSGYVLTLGINRREDTDVAATFASFCLVGGLAIGSLISFAVTGISYQCNLFN